MSALSVVSRLAEIAGLLSPVDGTLPEALDEARRLVTETLLNDQFEPMEDPSSPRSALATINALPQKTLDDLRHIIDEVIPRPRDRALRIFQRTWPLLTIDVRQSVPVWASSWTAESSIGPFETAEGGRVWFDVRHNATSLLLVNSQTERPLISLPQTSFSNDPINVGVTVLNIPAGSVWLAASMFDTNALSGSFVGLRIRSGILTLSHPGFINGITIRVSPGIVATLQLVLEPPEQRSQRTSQGGDARKVKANLPEQVTFTLSVGASGKLIEVSSAALDVYSNQFSLRNQEGVAPHYDNLLARLWFPMSTNRDAISIDDARSQVFRPVGEATVREAGWALAVAIPKNGDPSNLGESEGVGALAISLAKGLQATLAPAESSKPLLLDSTFLIAEPGRLSVIANTVSGRYRQVLDLWENNARGRSTIELQSNDPLAIRFDATIANGGAETLSFSTLECRSQLDRPVTAAGQRVPFASRRITLGVHRVASGTRIVLVAPADPPPDPITGEQTTPPPLSFALSNAFTRTSSAQTLQLIGEMNEQFQVDRGSLILRFELAFLLPSLPDPYASNIFRQAPRHLREAAFFGRGPQLAAHIQWNAPADPKLSFELGAGTAGGNFALSQAFMRRSDAPIQREMTRERDPVASVEERFPLPSEREVFRLLDVSTRADLFGVGFNANFGDKRDAPQSRTRLFIHGLDLIAPTQDVSAFTLPAFQWEPVYDIPAEGALPFPPKLVSPTDGGPTRFAMPSVKLVPFAPLPVLDTLLTEYNRKTNLTLAARFTLPFGMVAVAELRRRAFDLNFPFFGSPSFENVRPQFSPSNLAGGLQLSLQAARIALLGSDESVGLPGATVQTNNGTSGVNVLKSGSVDEIFNQTFADKRSMVPVRRIDFSGYGASIFSDWRRTDDKASGVTQVKFEAIVGRTSHEVVQVRSKVYPWGAIFVRIITMERTGSGGVFRRDSGWQAASDGDYKLLGCVVHPGVVPRLTNIRRIRDTTNVYERAYPISPGSDETVKLTQVVFDADVEVEGVTLGANASRLVPTRDIIGYVHISPIGTDGNIQPLTAEQLNDLLIATGPIGGSIDCELNVAQSGLHMRLSRIEVGRTTTLANNPQFVAVARGTVELPKAGQWTFAYRGSSEPEPHRLEANRPIPLIRANPTGGVIPPYRFADPRELHRPTNPESEYSLLHSTGAQRMLVPRPEIHFGDPTTHAGAALLFADMYTLAGGIALFPRPEQCHPLPAGSALRITGRRKMRLDIPAQPGLDPGEFKVGPLERTLSQSAALRVQSRFRP